MLILAVLILVAVAFLIGWKCGEAESTEASDVENLTQKILLDVHAYFSGKPNLSSMESKLLHKINNLKEIL